MLKKLCIAILSITAASISLARNVANSDGVIELKEGLAITGRGGARGGGRTAVAVDMVAAALAKGEAITPKAGEKLTATSTADATWREVKVNKDGIFTAAGGYVACLVDLPADATMLLEGSGDTLAFVNGVPHGGDIYSNGYVRIPVALHKGTNQILFAAGRGRLKARLIPTHAKLMLDTGDPTLPDIIPTDAEPLWAAVVVQNATDQEQKGLKLTAKVGDADAITTDLPQIAPMTIRKMPFRMNPPKNATGEKLTATLELVGADGKLDETTISLRVRTLIQTHKRTFVSNIDESVQYYAINPATKPADSNALVLTLHGASVEAIGQADAYGSKDWVTLVAPTNRRPYGFDWEDIGQLDALEVLAIAEKTIPHDPHRVVLTGHSMGGHGTWHVGLTFPDRFAAIGPSAGWSSFTSYAGARGGRGGAASKPPATSEMITRASAAGDTLSLIHNSISEDVYILHGEIDDNVPVAEARLMHDAISFHPNVGYHEEPGANHWWGSKCVDWPPMFEMFNKARLPDDADVDHIEFTTPNPAQSAACHWATIEQQAESLKPSSIVLTRKDDMVFGSTSNVALIAFDVSKMGKAPGKIELDGQRLTPKVVDGKIVLARHGNSWSAGTLDPRQKSSLRGGPLMSAFNHRMVFVYGTHGSGDDLDMARFVAEGFYYRGNGSIDVIPDTEFDANSTDRNVILFGNADTNSAWPAVLKDSPIQVANGSAKVGDHDLKGDDLAVLFLRPRAGSDTTMVGAIGFTGHAGALVITRSSLLSSGIGFPDWTVVAADALSTGIPGIRGDGFFANDWSIDPRQSAWAD